MDTPRISKKAKEKWGKRNIFHFNRWLGLSAAMLMMGCSGLTYTYAVYSEFIKEKLHYSQEQTDDLGAAKDFGAFIGLLSGLFYLLFPPWVSVFIGAAMHLLGNGMVLMTLSGRTEASFLLLCFYFVIAVGGDNWIDTACLMTSLENFEDFKGTAIGILKSQVGLSASIFVTVYDTFFKTSVINFLILVTLVPTGVFVGFAFLIRPFSEDVEERDEIDGRQRFHAGYISVVILGIFLMMTISLKEAFHLEGAINTLCTLLMFVLVAVMYTVPLLYRPMDLLQSAFRIYPATPVSVKLDHVRNSSGELTGEEEEEKEEEEEESVVDHLLKASDGLNNEHAVQVMEIERIAPAKEEMSSIKSKFWTSLVGIDFWLITFVVSSGAGSGLAIINNFAQIGKAMGSEGVDSFVGIIGIWSCFGRLVSGYGSDVLMKSGVPRPVCLLFSQLAMICCCILLAIGSMPCLFIGSALVGLSYGSYWTLAPTVISDVFGLMQVAALYKILGMGPTICSYIFSAKVLGALYDKEALRYQGQLTGQISGDNICYGRGCFGFGLLSLGLVCLSGAIACLWFVQRTKKIYSRTAYHHASSSLK